MGTHPAQRARLGALKDLMYCSLGQMTCNLDYSVMLAGKFRKFKFTKTKRVKGPTLKFEGGAPSGFLRARWPQHWTHSEWRGLRLPKIDVCGASGVIHICGGLQSFVAAIKA
jgi:hypothetical protein